MKKLLLMLLGVLVALPAFARDFSYTYQGQTVTYTVIDWAAKTCKTMDGPSTRYPSTPGNTITGQLVLPAHPMDGDVEFTLTEIGECGFENNKDLISVEIPNSVTSISKGAFRSCGGLTSIEIPSSVTSIGEHALFDCYRLTSIEIPNSVTSIGREAFRYCRGLTSIEIPNSMTSIGRGAFMSCSGLTSIEIPNSVTSIGDEAFYYCRSLTSVEIPNSVTSIGNQAFIGCYELKSITLTGAINKYGEEAFNSVSPDYITILADNPNEYLKTYEAYLPKAKKYLVSAQQFDEVYAAADRYTAEYYPLPFEKDGLKYESAFNPDDHYEIKITGLSDNHENIIFTPQINKFNVLSYPSDLLQNNNNVTNITFDSPLDNIPAMFCSGTGALRVVTLTENVKSIGDYAFSGSGVTTFRAEGAVPAAISENMFGDGLPESSKLLIVSEDKLEAYRQNEVWNKLFSLRVPGLANESGWKYDIDGSGNAILTCVDEEAVTDGILRIPAQITDGLITLNVSALRFESLPQAYTALIIDEAELPLTIDCDFGGLLGATCTSYEINRQLVKNHGQETTLGNIAALTDLKIGGTFSRLADNAFAGAVALKSVTFGQNVAEIGNHAFEGAIALPEITVDGKELKIGSHAFAGAEALTSVSFGDGVSVIGDNAFAGAVALKSVTFGQNVAEIGNHAFEGAKSLPEIAIDGKDLKIGSHAFVGAAALTSVSFGDGVSVIGDNAFYDNTKLSKAVFGKNITTIGDSAFYGTTRLNLRGALDLTGTGLRRIGRLAFAKNRMNEIKLPGTLVSIGSQAFSGCAALESLYIAEGNVGTIGEEAFAQNNRLKKVSFDAHIDSIGTKAFFATIALAELNANAGVGTIGTSAFEECDALTTVEIEADNLETRAFAKSKGLERFSVSGSGIVAYEVLADCPALKYLYIDNKEILAKQGKEVCKQSTLLETVEFGNNIEKIGNSAFYDNPIKNITFGTGLKSIGESAFRNQQCDSLIFPTVEKATPQLTIGDSAFYGSAKTTKVVDLGNIVGIVERYAFGFCPITDLNLGTSVTEIKTCAFLYAVPDTLRLPGSLRILYDHNFIKNIKKLHVDYSDGNGPLEFKGERYNEKISLSADEVYGNRSVFARGYNTANITANTLYLGTELDAPVITSTKNYWCNGINSKIVIGRGVKIFDSTSGEIKPYNVEIEEGLEELTGDIGFDDRSTQTSLTLPSTLRKVNANNIKGDNITQLIIRDGEGVISPAGTLNQFDGMPNLTDVYVGTEIEGLNFSANTKLEKAVIGDKVKAVGTDLFNGCASLTNVVVSDNVTEVRDNAFKDCTGLKVLPLSENLMKVGANAYTGCTGLERIVARGITPVAGDNIFSEDIQMNVPLYVPDEAFDAYFDSDAFFLFDNINPHEDQVAQDIVFDEEGTGDLDLDNKKPGNQFSILDLLRWIFRELGGRSNAPAKAIAKATETVTSPEEYGVYFFTPNPEAVSVDRQGNVTILKDTPAEIWAYALDGSDKKAVLGINNYKQLVGDLNSDRLIDVADVNILIDHVVNPDGSVIKIEIADINNDGIIDVADINVQIQKVLN